MENKKELILSETTKTITKLLVNDNSVTFIKETNYKDSNGILIEKKVLTDVLKQNIMTVKYEEASSFQQKGNGILSAVMFIISFLCFIGLIVLYDFEELIFVLIAIGIIVLIIGIVQLPSKTDTKENKLVFLDQNEKTLFSVVTELTPEEFHNITKAVRE